ncbi:MAG: C25 family cysteine peptidase [bacterium]
MKKPTYLFISPIKITLLFILFFAVGFSSIFGETIVLKDGSSGVDVRILSTDGNSTKVEFNFYSYNTEKVLIKGKEYYSISALNSHQLLEKGNPDLPILRKSIIISDDKATTYRVLYTDYVTQTLTSLAPSKGNFTRNIDPESVEYTFSNTYKTDEFFPSSNFLLSPPYVVRNLRGVTMQFNPIQYNPVQKQLKICTRLVVEIFNDNSRTAENPLIRNSTFKGVTKEFNDVYQTLFANYGNNGLEYNFIPEPGRLLIIYNQTYADQIIPFYNWKISKGTPTLLAKYPTETGTGAAALKTYIQNIYNSEESVTYIILIGEASEIPYLSGVYEGAPSDPCYVKLAGTDAYPDAFISRISPKSATNLTYILDKIKRYETSPYTGTNASWYLKGVGIASDEGTPTDWQRCNELRTMLLNDMHFTSVDQTYDPGATSSTVTTNVNEGRSIINYIGHGSGTSWSTTGFSVSSVNALNNGYKNPFIYDVACVNGDFTLTECLEEAWLRAGDMTTPKGAVGAFGASTNASWEPPCDMQKQSMVLLTTRQKMTVGGVCISGLMYAMDINGGSTGEGLKMMEQYHIFGDCSTLLTFGLNPDSTAPTPITNLNTIEPLSGAISVSWSVPIDSSIGGIISYDLRSSTSPITNSNFDAASSTIISGDGDVAGSLKTYEFNNLGFNATHYFAIKSVDIWGNVSDISNVISGTTLAAPQMTCSADSLVYTSIAGNSLTDSLMVGNGSANASTLSFSVEMTNSTFPENVIKVNITPAINNTAAIESYNKENPTEVRGISIEAHGGPDTFGYEWIDSDDSNGPAFEWNDISTTGTEATNWVATGTYSAKDEGYTTINLGFNFKFYGNIYSTVYASSNGYITFSLPSTSSYSNVAIPGSAEPNNFISPFWDDLDGKTTGKVFYKQEPNKLTIQYYNWEKYGTSTTGVLNYQIVLYSNGKIMYYYSNCTTTLNSCTVGIENHIGTDGLQIAKDANYVKPNLAVKIGAEPEWLSINYPTALVYNGNSAKVNLNISTADLIDGVYKMDLVIKTNDPNSVNHIVPIKLTVGSVVPVELTSFLAVPKGNNIQLSWSTATETNNNGFELQRKCDNEDWKNVVFIKGNGTSTDSHTYQYLDNLTNVKGSNVVYRLKQIDFDGSYAYSKTIEATLAPSTFSLEQNYPNPFNPSTTINFSIPEKSNVSIKVFNSLGQIIEELVNSSYEPGFYSIQFNPANYSSGVYYYQMHAGSFIQIKKMMMIK